MLASKAACRSAGVILSSSSAVMIFVAMDSTIAAQLAQLGREHRFERQLRVSGARLGPDCGASSLSVIVTMRLQYRAHG